MANQFDYYQQNNNVDGDPSFSNPVPVQPKYTQEQLTYMHDQEKNIKHAVEGARWFYWLAGLSAVNSLIAMLNGSISFIFGLGITQVIDAIAYYIAEDSSSQAALTVKIIALVFSILICGLSFLIGYFALKGKKWLMSVGIGLYIVDLLICLFFELYLDAFFHVFVLFFLIRGARAFSKLEKLKEEPAIHPVTSF